MAVVEILSYKARKCLMKFIYIHLTKSTHTAFSVPRQPYEEDKEERRLVYFENKYQIGQACT